MSFCKMDFLRGGVCMRWSLFDERGCCSPRRCRCGTSVEIRYCKMGKYVICRLLIADRYLLLVAIYFKTEWPR